MARNVKEKRQEHFEELRGENSEFIETRNLHERVTDAKMQQERRQKQLTKDKQTDAENAFKVAAPLSEHAGEIRKKVEHEGEMLRTLSAAQGDRELETLTSKIQGAESDIDSTRDKKYIETPNPFSAVLETQSAVDHMDAPRIRADLKEIFNDGSFKAAFVAKAIETLTDDKLDLFSKNIARIKEAHKLHLINVSSFGNGFRHILRLSADQFAAIQKHAETLPLAALFAFVSDPSLLSSLEDDDPRYPIADALLRSGERAAIGLLKEKKYYQPILENSNPKKYVQQRLDLLARYKKISPFHGLFSTDRLAELDEEIVALIEKMQDRRKASLFAEAILNRHVSKEEGKEKIDIWSKILTPEVFDSILVKNGGKMIEHFIGLRLSWIQALMRIASLEEFREHLLNPRALYSFVFAGRNSELSNMHSVDTMKTWEARAEVPVIERMPTLAGKQVVDIIRMTGLSSVLTQCVEEIEIVTVDEMQANGDYDPKTGKIRIVEQENPNNQKHIPGTVMHETGHAVERLLASKEAGQLSYDAYVAGIVYRDVTEASEYPAAIEKVGGRETLIFLREAFAEDFRILLQNPELLSPERRENMENIFSTALPDVGIEELRTNIRRMYGALYGTSVNDVQSAPTCAAVVRLARVLDQINYVKPRQGAAVI